MVRKVLSLLDSRTSKTEPLFHSSFQSCPPLSFGAFRLCPIRGPRREQWPFLLYFLNPRLPPWIRNPKTVFECNYARINKQIWWNFKRKGTPQPEIDSSPSQMQSCSEDQHCWNPHRHPMRPLGSPFPRLCRPWVVPPFQREKMNLYCSQQRSECR